MKLAGGILFVLGLSVLGAARAATPDSWVPTAASGAPAARAYHVAVWTGSRMIVWGGIGSGEDPLADGGVYDPVAKAWVPVSRVGAPSARALATAVWTGDRMIVFGGLNKSGTLNDGAAYDPATDSWTPISSAGAPSPRSQHTAVWTGTEMIVWGGFANELDPPYVPVASGAAYDPSTDTWRPTTLAHAPPPRASHVAVWTGDRMIVWGGSSGDGTLGDGGIYDPVTDSWTPTSTAGEPESRAGHTGAWVAGRFLVWGGLLPSEGHSTATGGIYDPATDTWTDMPIAGAPSPRDTFGSAVLAGRLVVWSGAYSGQTFSFTNTGGVFDPRSETWSLIALAGAPAARYSPSAVSTGESVIFWGGSADTLLDSGGEYFPPYCTGGERGCVMAAPETPPAVVEGRP